MGDLRGLGSCPTLEPRSSDIGGCMARAAKSGTVRTAVQRRWRLADGTGGDALTRSRLEFALAELEKAGIMAGARSEKLSARVDPGLLAAARRRTGLRSDSDLINAALAMVAGGDDFGTWLVQQAGRLPDGFEAGF